MNGIGRIGRVLFGVAMAVLGLLYLFHARGQGLVPGPPWTAETGTRAWLIGAGFVVAGVCIAAGVWARLAAVLLGIALLLRALLIFVPEIFAHVHDPGPWTSGFEVLALSAASFVMAGEAENASSITWDGLVFIGRILFAAALVVFGVQHFIYAKFVATLVTPWIPNHLFWAYFVGVAFIVAALSIAMKIQASLAAGLLGLMFLLWVAVLHVPRVMAALHNGNEWTSCLIALAMGGGSLVLSGALRRCND
ncbi:MAG TPA: hypothetical protein VFE38_12070 [Edaphobacter sp.]|nr:hypothetical protein [Edaphobacter sp.]